MRGRKRRLGKLRSRVFHFMAAALFAISSMTMPVGQAKETCPVTPKEAVAAEMLIETAPVTTVYVTKIENLAVPVESRPEPAALPYSMEEIDLIARLAMAEAGNQPEQGIRWVIDTILNRVDSPRWPDTVRGVIFAKNPVQFSCTVDGNFAKAYVREDIKSYVLDEIIHRSNSKVTSFRTGHYHSWATPVAKIGDHYFSK